MTFILDSIAEKEKIEVLDDEVEKAIETIALQNRFEPAKYKEVLVAQKKLDSLRYQLREDKVLDYLIEKAKIEVIEKGE
jgi:trigger factor